MRRHHFVLLVCLLGVIAVLSGMYWSYRSRRLATVRPVPDGDQEIAWLESATTGTNWERFVVALSRLARIKSAWPKMTIVADNAFPERTVEVPELEVSFAGCDGTLRFRWYKITSEMTISRWVAELAQRDPPPLALVGGSSSSEALQLATSLAAAQSSSDASSAWRQSPPLLFITTATADRVWNKGEKGPDIMDLYPRRTFRFCCRNRLMADAVLDLILSRPELRPVGDPPPIFRLEWQDNPYSLDLSNQFAQALRRRGLHPLQAFGVRYSVGEFHRPNPPESQVLHNLIAGFPSSVQRPLLIVPVGSQPARRFLHAMTTAAPQTRNLVVATGDSISFNTVYRDRDFAWHIQDVPVPLVFFCHHDPVAWDAVDGNQTDMDFATSTDLLLLHSSILEKTLRAAFPWARPQAALVRNAEELRQQLWQQSGDFFEASGNRQPYTGEHVVTLRPRIQDGRVLPVATLEVWARRDNPKSGEDRWRRRWSKELRYDGRSSPNQSAGVILLGTEED